MATSLRLTFTKLTGKYDALVLVRPDGSSEQIQCPKQGMIPHEMVHFAVEKTLAESGFLGRIAEGERVAAMVTQDVSEAVARIV